MINNNLLHVNLNREGRVTRRALLQLAGGGFAGAAGLGVLRSLGLNAEEMKKSGRACILCFLSGGPSQLETFDPKPGHSNGGPTKTIQTGIPGVEFAEYWPKMAALTKQDVSVIRSVAGREAAHERGRYHLRTGRRMIGGVKFPHMGAMVAHKLGDPDSDIPNFISIGDTISSGFLGVEVAPFIVTRAGELPANVAAPVKGKRAERRLELLRAQDRDLAEAGASYISHEHQELYRKASKMMTSSRLKAFTLEGESEKIRNEYGDSQFGQGCLVARRLVESGVPFVEVQRGGWDMHSNLWQNMPNAAGDVDRGLSALITDLKQRGMLEKTLVLCFGEFGRTPRINQRAPNVGRDHWARNFSLLIAGGGIKGGVCVGKTNDECMEIVDQPVDIDDLFQTIYTCMGIDPDEEIYTPDGRPLRIVEEGLPVYDLLS
jgi:hypothetical protein